jgi:hypothetical protein
MIRLRINVHENRIGDAFRELHVHPINARFLDYYRTRANSPENAGFWGIFEYRFLKIQP